MQKNKAKKKTDKTTGASKIRVQQGVMSSDMLKRKVDAHSLFQEVLNNQRGKMKECYWCKKSGLTKKEYTHPSKEIGGTDKETSKWICDNCCDAAQEQLSL